MSRYLGIDYGTKRVGLAISDALGITARPLDVVPRKQVLEKVEEVIDAEGVDVIVMGLPTGLSGHEGASATEARNLAAELTERTGLPVELVDERFTSRMAESALLESGMKRANRREAVDKVAAAIILQSYLDSR